MKAKKTIIIILILSLIMIVGGVFVYFYYDELFNSKNDLTEVKLEDNDFYDDVRKLNDDYVLVVVNEKYGIIDNDSNVVEEIKYDEIAYLTDYYYYVELDGIKTLKRKGNVVADITNYEYGKVYKDESDSSSEYIMIDEFIYNERYKFLLYYGGYILDDSLRATKIIKNYDVYNGSNGMVEYGSIIYDSKTGKVIKEVPGIIENINDDTEYSARYFVHGSAGATSTRYDKDFNNLLDDIGVFSSFQCDGNNVTAVTNAKSNASTGIKYGYYSIEKDKLILPIEYDNIISKNDSESLFVVKNNGKYILLDENNTRKFKDDYEYIEIVNNFIFAVKDNTLKVYNKELTEMTEYSYDIDLNTSVDLGGLCEAPYSQIYNLGNNYTEVGILNIATTSGKKIFVVSDNSIEILDENVEFTYVNTLYNDKEEYFYVKSDFNNDIVEKITIYNDKMNMISEIDVKSYNIKKDDIYTIPDYYAENLFGVIYLIIGYKDSEDVYKSLVYDIDKNKFVDSEIRDFSSIRIEKIEYEYSYFNRNEYSSNYYYKVTSTDKDKKLTLYDKNKKIIDSFNDVNRASIINNYFVLEGSKGDKLYKLN